MKKFVRTANFEYINLDFVKSIVYRKIQEDTDRELFEIILDCVDGEVILGYVLDEDWVLDIINALIKGRDPTCDYMSYEEAIKEK